MLLTAEVDIGNRFRFAELSERAPRLVLALNNNSASRPKSSQIRL
jgi:hypothetical protein